MICPLCRDVYTEHHRSLGWLNIANNPQMVGADDLSSVNPGDWCGPVTFPPWRPAGLRTRQQIHLGRGLGVWPLTVAGKLWSLKDEDPEFACGFWFTCFKRRVYHCEGPWKVINPSRTKSGSMFPSFPSLSLRKSYQLLYFRQSDQLRSTQIWNPILREILYKSYGWLHPKYPSINIFSMMLKIRIVQKYQLHCDILWPWSTWWMVKPPFSMRVSMKFIHVSNLDHPRTMVHLPPRTSAASPPAHQALRPDLHAAAACAALPELKPQKKPTIWGMVLIRPFSLLLLPRESLSPKFP